MRDSGEREFTDIVRRGFAAALDFLLPRKCVVCESILGPAEMHICSDCLEDLPRTYYWIRKFNPMADKFNALIQKWVEDGLTARENGCLADIIPTLIECMGEEQPAEMTGKSLLVKKD